MTTVAPFYSVHGAPLTTHLLSASLGGSGKEEGEARFGEERMARIWRVTTDQRHPRAARLAPPLQTQISRSKPLQASLAFQGDHARSGLKDSVPDKGCVSHDGT